MSDLTLCRFCNAKVPRGSVMCDRCTVYAEEYLEEYCEALSGGARLTGQHNYWARRYRDSLAEIGED